MALSLLHLEEAMLIVYISIGKGKGGIGLREGIALADERSAAECVKKTVFMREHGAKLAKKWRNCVGAGTAPYGLRAEWQRQFEVTVAQCGFEHARLSDWGKLDLKDMKDADALCDFLCDHNIAPVVRLDVGDDVDLNGFARHAIARYGAKRVHNWKFEAPYSKGFEQKAKSLKAVDGDVSVGVVAGVSRAAEGGLKAAAQCRDIDFVVLSGSMESLEEKAFSRVVSALEKLPGMPVHWDGIDAAHTQDDALRDAITLTKRHLGLGGAPGGTSLDSLSLVSFSGICRKGAYLVDDFGVRQPSGHAFRMMDLLGDEEIQRGKGYIVTKNTQGKVRAMAWSDPTNPDTLEIIGLAPFERLMIETLDEEHGFANITWRQMGCPSSPTRHQAQALRQAALQTDVKFVKADARGVFLMPLPKDSEAITILKA